MDSERIDELLNKYWKCETSLEEEQQLHAYFQKGNTPDQWKETALLFRYFDEHKKKSLNDVSFETGLMDRIHTPKQGKVRKLIFNSMRIAAGIVVLMVAVWFIRSEVRKTTPQEIVDTYNDPQLAFEETKKALLMISRGFGKAEEHAKKIDLFNEAQKEIQGNNDKEQSQL